tara:strand:- start:3321 stop:3590 length:270 start_codon:yes stop_codon:yes gene_type:complete
MYFMIGKEKSCLRNFPAGISLCNAPDHDRTSSRGWQLTDGSESGILDLITADIPAGMRAARDNHNIMSRPASKETLTTARRGGPAVARR